LALRELGSTIDLHGGGSDLIFPHHECERAQSEAATGELFVKHWMHVAMVFMNGSKMSKSLGNLEFVDRLRKQHDPRAIRLALIANHYRHEWEWTPEAMPAAHNRLQMWSQAIAGDGSAGIEQVRNALDDDLNVPAAIAVLDDAAKSGHNVALGARLLGVEV
jgi:L-cysteine:1D-myo-inositol 2-amino-2-deoxy-alpha-D-glucopyranoside ligase